MPRYTKKREALEPLTHLTQAGDPHPGVLPALPPSPVLVVSVFDDLQPLVDDVLQSLGTSVGPAATASTMEVEAVAMEAEETVGTESMEAVEADPLQDDADPESSASPNSEDDSDEDVDINQATERGWAKKMSPPPTEQSESGSNRKSGAAQVNATTPRRRRRARTGCSSGGATSSVTMAGS
jgi:hypothetical protein